MTNDYAYQFSGGKNCMQICYLDDKNYKDTKYKAFSWNAL